MEASFANIQAFIEDRLNSNCNQDVHDSNRSFSAPSPAPINQAPSQIQTDPSMRNPRIGYGPGGETQELGQAESATSLRPCVLWASRFCRVFPSQIG